jgi:polyisoprenoid-binding protein YceI
MYTRNLILSASAFLLLSAFTLASAVQWHIKDGYSVQFSGTEVEGVFKSLKGTVTFDPKDLEHSRLNFTLDVNSINTGNGMKNKHALSDKWFDAEKYPEITFQSSAISKTSSGFEVTGEMQIHGVRKKMTIPFQFNNETFTASFSVNRMDFGVGSMEGMSAKVSNEIKLKVSIPVQK